MIFAQIGRFVSVGVMATLLHVLTAIAVQSQLGFSAQISNLTGYLAAFGLSYIGHARVTFSVAVAQPIHLRRFFIVSLLGLGLSASITHLVATVIGAPFVVAMVTVGALVPLMTFIAAKYWAFSKAEPTAFKADMGSCLIVFFGATCFAVLQNNLINHDTAWYLVATRKWLDGATLYVDLVEVNPPLNFYLTAPAIWIADGFGLRDIQAQILVLVLLMTVSLLWAWSILNDAPKLSQNAMYIILAGAAFSLTVPYLKYYGQREHILSILLLPYLLATVFPSRHEASKSPEITRAIFAGVGLCLKPHFMLIPIAVALATALRDKSIRPLFSASILTFLAMGLGYIGLVKLWHPTYLDTIVPIALQVYGAYGHDTPTVIEKSSPVLLAAFSILALVAIGSNTAKSATPLMAAAVACVGIYFLQWTGYGYQAKPSVALISLVAVLVLATPKARLSLRVLPVVCLGLVSIDGYKTGFYKSPMAMSLEPYLTAAGSQRRLAVFSSSLWLSFPLVLHADAKWTSRYPALWLIPGALNEPAKPTCVQTPQDCKGSADILAQTRGHIVDDFINGQADMLLIDNQPSYISDPNFSYIEFLSADPAFKIQFQNYTRLESSDKFDLYIRNGN